MSSMISGVDFEFHTNGMLHVNRNWKINIQTKFESPGAKIVWYFFLIVSFLCRKQSSLIRSSANFIVHIQWPLCPIQQTRGSSRSGHKFLLLHIKIFLCHCSRNCNNSKTVWVTWKQQLPLPRSIPVRQLENLLFIICIQVLKNFDELWWLFDIFVYLVCCLCILCVMRIDAFVFVCMCTVESSTPHLSMTQPLLFLFMFIYDRQMMKP